MKKISKIISKTCLERIKLGLRLINVKTFRYVDLSILSMMLSLCFSNPICYASQTFGQSENSVITKNESWEIKFFKAWRTENGNYQYGLFIDLDDNWKTYWKHPGNSGFKPEFQILKSKNLAKLEVLWPAPDIFYENGIEIYAFKSKLILPILIHPQEINNPVAFELKLNLGFCKDICVAKTFHLESENVEHASNFQNSKIRESLKNVPVNLTASKRYISCAVTLEGKKLILSSKLDTQFFTKEKKIKDAIFYYGDGTIWFNDKMQHLAEKTQMFTATLNHVNNQNILLDRSKIELTFLTQNGGFILNGCPY